MKRKNVRRRRRIVMKVKKREEWWIRIDKKIIKSERTITKGVFPCEIVKGNINIAS